MIPCVILLTGLMMAVGFILYLAQTTDLADLP